MVSRSAWRVSGITKSDGDNADFGVVKGENRWPVYATTRAADALPGSGLKESLRLLCGDIELLDPLADVEYEGPFELPEGVAETAVVAMGKAIGL